MNGRPVSVPFDHYAPDFADPCRQADDELRQALGALRRPEPGLRVGRDRAFFAENADAVRGHASIPMTLPGAPSACEA